MEQFMKINTAVNGFVWGPVMLALLVGTGIYLSIAVGFIQFTKIGCDLRELGHHAEKRRHPHPEHGAGAA